MINTSHLEKRYQVFISSTFLDLEEARKHLSNALYKRKYIVEGMENFAASDLNKWQIIRDRIARSDVYVLIVSDRYGTIASNASSLEPGLVKRNEKISYTHLEFRYALSLGLPILAFLNSNKYGDINIDKFIKEVRKAKISPGYWKDITDLLTGVLPAIEELLSHSNSSNKGWVKASSLATPISYGDPSVYFLNKIHYVKFISYSNRNSSGFLYRKYIPRLGKEVEVWDEYVTLTVNVLSHIVKDFQAYFRTDGDAVDFASLFPFINKLHFTDSNAQAHDKQFNPRINEQSSTFVFANSYYNGFQDGIMDISVKANRPTNEMRLIVDFTSIPGFDTLFRCLSCEQKESNGEVINLSSSYTLIQPGVYMIHRMSLNEESVLRFNFA